MLRRVWTTISALAAAALLALTTGAPPEAPAAAQHMSAARAELVDRLLTDDLTREEMVGLYEALAPGEFEPPACVSGDEMFTDVPASSQFCPWIEELARRGIATGCTADEYCPGDPVTRAQMAVFVVRATADEGFHIVGTPGEPPFLDGGENDCVWQNVAPAVLPTNRVSFYKDSDGIVHLAGMAMALPEPAGDGECDVTNGDYSDAKIFRLPADYRPQNLEAFPNGIFVDTLYVAPIGGMTVNGTFFAGGTVFVGTIDNEVNPVARLDGATFRAADGPAPTLSNEPPSVSPEALRNLFSQGPSSMSADGKR